MSGYGLVVLLILVCRDVEFKHVFFEIARVMKLRVMVAKWDGVSISTGYAARGEDRSTSLGRSRSDHAHGFGWSWSVFVKGVDDDVFPAWMATAISFRCWMVSRVYGKCRAAAVVAEWKEDAVWVVDGC